MMKSIRGIFLFALVLVGAYGCKPDPVFPAEPMLTFKEFIQEPGSDSLRIVFSFTDGDGDIGVAVNNPDPNMKVYLYGPNAAGTFIPLQNLQTADTTDTLTYQYRIPPLSTGQSGLEGDIYITVYKSFLLLSGEDTLQFDAFLKDQSNHKSAIIRTPTVILTP
jgi:hypothetical protein